ncbi:MAG TPA: FixH family protein [Pyrinomonadaceae bacterium]|nr:FixH family protein [Pyrinomonadaceae bacterium]
MIARKQSLLFVLFVMLLAFACQKTAKPPDITLQYEIVPQPPRVGTVIINLKLTDRNGTPVSGARVDLEGNMSHAGMSPVNREAKEIETGKYSGTLQLPMAGDWIVLVHITLSDGQKLQRQIEVSGVR